eukprot:Amastigsp_a183695_6.p2 type:complete len:167 gc:universal Amastigsp_a183695_6:214-714(+)
MNSMAPAISGREAKTRAMLRRAVATSSPTCSTPITDPPWGATSAANTALMYPHPEPTSRMRRFGATAVPSHTRSARTSSPTPAMCGAEIVALNPIGIAASTYGEVNPDTSSISGGTNSARSTASSAAASGAHVTTRRRTRSRTNSVFVRGGGAGSSSRAPSSDPNM